MCATLQAALVVRFNTSHFETEVRCPKSAMQAAECPPRNSYQLMEKAADARHVMGDHSHFHDSA
jgi:hypothetical protein